MNEALKMFAQMTFEDLPSAISSQESASGPTPSALPVGQMIDRSGRDLAHASLSPRQAKELGLLTSGTSGRRGTGSLSSVVLTSSLGSKLKARTDGFGSTLYQLTWKVSTTPWGRSFCLLRASVLRKGDTDCGSWPTPTVSSGDYQIKNGERILKLSGAAKLANWPTPKASDGQKGGPNRGDLTLPSAAAMAGWPTPKASDMTGGGQAKRHKERSNLNDFVMLAGWATPTAKEAGGSPEQFLERKRRSASRMGISLTALNLQEQLTAFGEMPNGSTAATGSIGQLNPAHSRWLQALPPEWDDCAVMAMQSMPKRRKSSSSPPSKR